MPTPARRQLGDFAPTEDSLLTEYAQDYNPQEIEAIRDMWRRYAAPRFRQLLDASEVEPDDLQANDATLAEQARAEEESLEAITQLLIERAAQDERPITKAEALGIIQKFNGRKQDGRPSK